MLVALRSSSQSLDKTSADLGYGAPWQLPVSWVHSKCHDVLLLSAWYQSVTACLALSSLPLGGNPSICSTPAW